MNRLSNNNRRDRKNNNDERLEIDKTEGMIKQVLEEIRREKTEEVEWKESFLMVKCRNFKNLSDYEEGKKSKRSRKKNHGRTKHIWNKIKKYKRIINRCNRTGL